jgi:hypothetical protein
MLFSLTTLLDWLRLDLDDEEDRVLVARRFDLDLDMDLDFVNDRRIVILVGERFAERLFLDCL